MEEQVNITEEEGTARNGKTEKENEVRNMKSQAKSVRGFISKKEEACLARMWF